MKGDTADPKGLIFEAFRIDGISEAECRSVFLDWALSLGADVSANEAIELLLARYSDEHMDHPMLKVLREGMGRAEAPRRRGGGRARRGDG
ncbi:hypothetical protein [Palleronia caenipelagi]|uniref:Uncharacterized protein n=1 Tax=Palleronia caenipelagi TaxID=2489174 RepID=A0A547PXK9_9RHOB|nr:hypothetical protein [Palleronia caenipelagi]TRD18891.1 hypothetical protein FEV53_11715 [Palleronia caenipelagi]